MTRADLTSDIEQRLRDAYADAIETVQQHDLRPAGAGRMPATAGQALGGPGWSGRRRPPLLVPVGAAAAVLLVAAAAVVIPRMLHQAADRPHPSWPARPECLGHPTQDASAAGSPSSPGLPRYLLTFQSPGVALLDIRNASTGTLTCAVRTPLDYRTGGTWFAVAAQGPRTFIAVEDFAGPANHGLSYFYRILVNPTGSVASIRRVGAAVHGMVMSVSVNPDGKRVGYLLMSPYDNGYPHASLVIADLASGKIAASWPIPDTDYIASMSMDAAGDALAISAYAYDPASATLKVHDQASLVQWTSILRSATSGTSISKLPRLLPQAGSLAISPDGRTLYEFLQAGRVTGASWRSPARATFELAAIDTGTGDVVSVLHTWRAVWAGFVPQLSLDPAGSYLLIFDGTRLASVATATGSYTPQSGTVPALQTHGKFQQAQGVVVSPLAW